MKKSSVFRSPVSLPKVSVMIPARNEEENIARCLRSLLGQDYPDYKILVLDDQSTDRTGKIISGFAKENFRIRVFRGKELPEGWKGKKHVCQQLAEQAEGEYYLFTDADTVHSRKSISWAAGKAQETGPILFPYFRIRHDERGRRSASRIPAIAIWESHGPCL